MPGDYEGRRDPRSLRLGESFASRLELSSAFGGTPYRGISYEADGDWAILVSSAAGHDDFGYKDGWVDDRKSRFRYSGEWHGCGDMEMSGGNAAVDTRSPFLFLFVREPHGFVFSGRFRMVKYDMEKTTRPLCRHQHSAIRFELERV